MTLHCKPGDTAEIIVPGPHLGRRVEVMFAAPRESFYLPDGTYHEGMEPGFWVIKSLGEPFSATLHIGGRPVVRREAKYGACHDGNLKPHVAAKAAA